GAGNACRARWSGSGRRATIPPAAGCIRGGRSSRRTAGRATWASRAWAPGRSNGRPTGIGSIPGAARTTRTSATGRRWSGAASSWSRTPSRARRRPTDRRTCRPSGPAGWDFVAFRTFPKNNATGAAPRDMGGSRGPDRIPGFGGRMKKLGWVVLALLSYSSWAASIGCGGVSKQEFDALKAEMTSRDEEVKSSLRSELTGIDKKYITVQQLQNNVERQLDEMKKLATQLNELSKSTDAKANVAASNALKALQFEEKMMSERLAELRSLIEELKKK